MNIKHLIKPQFKIESHMKLADATSVILKDDGYDYIYQLLHSTDTASGKTFLEILVEGAKDADIPFSGGYICHMMHFHHPWSHRGYLSKTSSADVTARLFTIASNHWKLGKKAVAAHHLGRALHLIQDILIPQHAGITSRKGHGELEQWLLENWEDYRVYDGGLYTWQKTFTNPQGNSHHVMSDNLYDWIDYGSHLSIQWFDDYFACGSFNEGVFKEVAPLTIPYALRLSAGFLYKFFSQVEL